MRGVPEASRPTILTRLAALPVVHRAIRVLRIQQLASTVFSAVPLKRQLKRSKLTYRVRHLESLLVADELFKREIYKEAFADRDIKTFVDVGSNVGYFPLYVVEHTGRKDVRGLVIDGNEAMARESRWHVDGAQLAGIRVRHGLVGHPKGVNEATFYVNASNVASSAQPTLNPNVPAKGASTAVTVPVIDIFEEWRKTEGDRRIDLMKIDVEGFECDLIKNCGDALAITDRIVIEWHKWMTTREEVAGLLAERGFELRRVISEDDDAGVAVFDRRPSRD